MADRRPDGSLTVITGATGSGKTLYALTVAKAAPRLIVWDVEGQYRDQAQCQAAQSRADLVRLARDGRVRRIAYQAPPSPAEFEFFCRVAWLWLQLAPAVVIVEELADVTSPAKAPATWGVIVRRGRKYGAKVLAVTQRPAESDKSCIGNAAAIVCFRASRAQDRDYMARELDVPADRVAALRPLEYLRRDLKTGEVRPGRVRPPRS